MRNVTSPILAVCFVALVHASTACGSSDSATSSDGGGGTSAAAGGAGKSAGGASAGAAGVKSGAGAAGSAGSAGAHVGGAAGSGGKAGGAGGKAGGAAGASAGGSNAGSGGTVAGAGAGGSNAGHAGAPTAGAAGAAGCKVDADCTDPIPATIPMGCAVHHCDAPSGTCSLVAADKDSDGHPANKCITSDQTPVKVGDDCDDSDPNTYFGAWDGPAGDGNPDRCDQTDNDCDGEVDDGKLADGTTCTCTPGTTAPCSEESTGKPIVWPGPGGVPTGECHYGTKLCSNSGVYGLCTGYVLPATQELCNHLDDDCDGVVDNDPVDQVTWVYDGDNDGHALIPDGDPKAPNAYEPITACSYAPPQTAPVKCTASDHTWCTIGTGDACCPPTSWKLGSAAQGDDCNDQDPQVNPAGHDQCDGKDYDCNGHADDNCTCSKGETKSCAVAGKCNDGAVETCDPSGGNYGACSQAPAANAGVACGSGAGACADVNSAQFVCTGPSSGGTICKDNANVGPTVTAWFSSSYTYMANNTFEATSDYNCDGFVEPQYASPGKTTHADQTEATFFHNGVGACALNKTATFEADCNSFAPGGVVLAKQCPNGPQFAYCTVATGGNFCDPSEDSTCPDPGCGTVTTMFYCAPKTGKGGTTCSYQAAIPAASYTMACH